LAGAAIFQSIDNGSTSALSWLTPIAPLLCLYAAPPAVPCCCSYGFISNLNYGTALGAAWIAFVKKYGVAPTAPGQWQVFLAFYAGKKSHGWLQPNLLGRVCHWQCCVSCSAVIFLQDMLTARQLQLERVHKSFKVRN
jgi:hypothetical protein